MHNRTSKVASLLALLGVATLPSTANTLDPEYVNNYHAALPTISAQELKQKLEAYQKADEANAATSGLTRP